MKITVIIYSDDAETVWNGFRFATTSMVYDNDVTVFLLGKGIEAKTVGTLKYDVREQIDLYIESGGKMIGCGVCCESRKEEMPLLEQELDCELGSMQQLYTLVSESDKVLSF